MAVAAWVAMRASPNAPARKTVSITNTPAPTTKAPIGREALDNQRRGVAFLVGLAILAGLVYLIQGAFDWDAARIDPLEGSVAAVGSSIFSRFVLPFEVISFLLLAALIGAIVLSRKEDRP